MLLFSGVARRWLLRAACSVEQVEVLADVGNDFNNAPIDLFESRRIPCWKIGGCFPGPNEFIGLEFEHQSQPPNDETTGAWSNPLCGSRTTGQWQCNASGTAAVRSPTISAWL